MTRTARRLLFAALFAVGMLICFLVAKGTANLNALAGPGFYFFASYCLVSNLAFQLLEKPSADSSLRSE